MTGVLLDCKVVVLVFLRVGRVAHEQKTTHNEYNTNTTQHQWLGLAVQEALRSVIPPKPITDDELNNVDVGSDEAHFKCVVCNKVRGGVVALSWDGLAEWSGKGWVSSPNCPHWMSSRCHNALPKGVQQEQELHPQALHSRSPP